MSELLLVTASSKGPKPQQDAAPRDKSAGTCHRESNTFPVREHDTVSPQRYSEAASESLCHPPASATVQLSKPQSFPLPAAFSFYKLVLFPELLCSPLFDGLFDRAE